MEQHREPMIVAPALMRDISDCGIACLEMLLGRTYAEVLSACPKRAKVTTQGITERQMYNIAQRLGASLRRVTFEHNADIEHLDDDMVGILDLLRQDGSDGHLAFYARGTVYNPSDGLWWMDAQAYLRRGHWQAKALHFIAPTP